MEALKSLRDKGYTPEKKEGIDSGEENKTPRIISLTDDEKQLFSQAQPGNDLVCEVHGSLESDGHFHVMSVSPLNGSSEDEKEMAGQVAQRVMPNIVPSPS